MSVRNAINSVDICKIYNVDKNDTKDTIVEMLSKYSEFSRDKDIVFKRQLGKGSFGFVFLLKIGEEEYAVKVQKINDTIGFKEMATEVTISNILKENRRSDSHRIAMPIFDCFFLCNKDKQRQCSGVMVHIMEKGEGSVEDLLSLKPNDPMGKIEIKTMLIRDVMVKMIENIHIMVTQGDIINVDLKPGNSVYNWKKKGGVGQPIINPVLIDFGPDFCFNRIELFINLEKLSHILNGYTKYMRPLMSRELTIQDSRVIISYILQYQYLLYSMKLLDMYESRNDKRKYDIMSIVFFGEKESDELISIKDMLEIFINPKPENMWLAASMRLILSSKLVDSRNTFQIRRNFYHYIVGGRSPDTKELKSFETVCGIVKNFYDKCMASLKIKKTTNFQHIDLKYANSISGSRKVPFVSIPTRAKSDPIGFPIKKEPSEEHIDRVSEALSNSYDMLEGETSSNLRFVEVDKGVPKDTAKSTLLTAAMKMKKKAGL